MRYHPFRHLGLKMLAIALASLLWLTVAGEHVVERSLRVPLEFRNIPEALEIVGNAPDTVDVRLRGSSALLSRLQPGEIVAVLDLGTARDRARGSSTSAPTKCARRSASRWRRSCRRRWRSSSRSRRGGAVPVVPAIEGDPAPGFVVGRMTADPATVEIVGPDSRVRQVAEATTEPVSVKDAKTRVRDGVTIGVARLVGPAGAAAERAASPSRSGRRRSSSSCRTCRCASATSAQGLSRAAVAAVRRM